MRLTGHLRPVLQAILTYAVPHEKLHLRVDGPQAVKKGSGKEAGLSHMEFAGFVFYSSSPLLRGEGRVRGEPAADTRAKDAGFTPHPTLRATFSSIQGEKEKAMRHPRMPYAIALGKEEGE
ncbi:hypothetical protein [Asticcacaulis solisilvae]|uniref:hypothetical protein n=1 Tax=Asticcacaulis solisilvae TaxID=1217274 RepID=UPI003FD7C4F1